MNQAFQSSKIAIFVCLLFIVQSCSKSDDLVATPVPVTPVTPVTNNDGFIPPATADIVMYEINPTAFSASKTFKALPTDWITLKL